MEKYPFTFIHPSTCSISGPSGSGKTCLTVDILNNLKHIYSPTPSRVVYYYSQWQEIYKNIRPAPVFIKGLPTEAVIDGIKEPTLYVIDDSMDKLDQTLCNIFLKYSHHKNLSVILLLQNFYSKNKHLCDINTNTNYVIFMKNPRNNLVITYLARESFPKAGEYVMESYKDATKEAYGYLLFNFKQEATDDLRLITNIIPKTGTYQIGYIPK